MSEVARRHYRTAEGVINMKTEREKRQRRKPEAVKHF